MKKNLLMRTNLLVCLIILAGFSLTAILSYHANYSASLKNIEQVSDLTSEGIYYQIAGIFTKPINISLTMANDSLLREFLADEKSHPDDAAYIETLRVYLDTYRMKYGYDSVFLASAASARYYNFNGLDRILTKDSSENDWFYNMLQSSEDFNMNVDNDEVEGAENNITVFVNCKIKDEAGNALGIVGVGLRISNLQELLGSYETDFGVRTFLVDEKGMIEISTDYTGYEKVSLFDHFTFTEETRQEILDWKEEESAASMWAENGFGQSYLVSRYIPELNWHLVVERNTGKLIEELKIQLVQTIAVIVLIVIGILFTITKVIRSYNRQIVSLTKAIEQERRTVFEQATEQLYENINELDITHNCTANQTTERYFESLGAPAGTPYDKALRIIADKQIKEEFREGYIKTFCPEYVMHSFQEGRETLSYDFMITKDGAEYYWMRITARIVQWESDHSVHMLTYRQNIDAEKRQETRMKELAQIDEMTGMLTKTATQRRIEQILKENPEKQYAFFILDIDNFKQANDRFGHGFGDSVIHEFTEGIRERFGTDSILGRIGGDEFAAFVPVSDRTQAEGKARELCGALNFDYTVEGNCWHIATSIGVAVTPDGGRSFAELYKHADSALYKTKERGKNGFTVYE